MLYRLVDIQTCSFEYGHILLLWWGILCKLRGLTLMQDGEGYCHYCQGNCGQPSSDRLKACRLLCGLEQLQCEEESSRCLTYTQDQYYVLLVPGLCVRGPRWQRNEARSNFLRLLHSHLQSIIAALQDLESQPCLTSYRSLLQVSSQYCSTFFVSRGHPTALFSYPSYFEGQGSFRREPLFSSTSLSRLISRALWDQLLSLYRRPSKCLYQW